MRAAPTHTNKKHNDRDQKSELPLGSGGGAGGYAGVGGDGKAKGVAKAPVEVTEIFYSYLGRYVDILVDALCVFAGDKITINKKKVNVIDLGRALKEPLFDWFYGNSNDLAQSVNALLAKGGKPTADDGNVLKPIVEMMLADVRGVSASVGDKGKPITLNEWIELIAQKLSSGDPKLVEGHIKAEMLERMCARLLITLASLKNIYLYEVVAGVSLISQLKTSTEDTIKADEGLKVIANFVKDKEAQCIGGLSIQLYAETSAVFNQMRDFMRREHEFSLAIEGLNVKISGLVEKNKTLEETLAKAEAGHKEEMEKTVKPAFERMQFEVAQGKEEIKALNGALKQAKDEHEKYVSEIAEPAFAEVSEQVEEERNKADQAEKDVAKAQAEIAELRAALMAANEAADEAQKAAAEAQSEVAELHTALSDTKEVEEERATLMQQLEAEREERARLQAENTALRKALAAAEKAKAEEADEKVAALARVGVFSLASKKEVVGYQMKCLLGLLDGLKFYFADSGCPDKVRNNDNAKTIIGMSDEKNGNFAMFYMAIDALKSAYPTNSALVSFHEAAKDLLNAAPAKGLGC